MRVVTPNGSIPLEFESVAPRVGNNHDASLVFVFVLVVTILISHQLERNFIQRAVRGQRCRQDGKDCFGICSLENLTNDSHPLECALALVLRNNQSMKRYSQEEPTLANKDTLNIKW